MKQFWSTLAVLGMCVAVAACGIPYEQQVVDKAEDMLSDSGFRSVSADTPTRQAAMKNLPPHKFAKQTHKGKVLWVYPDPTICACLYVGSQAACDTYRKKAFQRKIDDAVEASSAAPNDLDWGPWGGVPPGWGYY